MIITLLLWPRRRRPSTTGSRSRLSPSAPNTAPPPVLSDSQWNLIKDLFENPDPSPQGGRPRVEARACLEGVRWVFKTSAAWKY
jgi:hypothetical protein